MNKYFLILALLFNDFCMASSELYDKNEEVRQILNSNAYTPNYLSMFLGLAFVICLIYLTGFLYQKLIKVKLGDNDADTKDKIQIISACPLGQGKNLYIIKVNNESVLIGATQNNISFLKNIDSADSQEVNNVKNN